MNSGMPINTRHARENGIQVKRNRRLKNNLGEDIMDTSYKKSEYNLFLDTDDQYYLLYNTRSGAFAAVPSKIKNTIEKILSCPDASTDQEIKKELINGGFIIEESINELKTIRERHENRKLRKDIMGLVLMPSETCNFRCPYCFIYDYRGFNMQKWVYEAVLNLIKRSIVPDLTLHLEWFGGEPTLTHKDNVKFMKELNALGKENKFRKIYYLMLTNAYLLTSERFKEYLDLGLDTYQITLDGAKERHDKTRFLANGKGTYDVIWQNLLNIQKLPNDFKILIRNNFLKEDEEECYKFMQVFKDAFGTDKRFRVYFYPIWNTETKRNTICEFANGIHPFEDGRLKGMEYDFSISKRLELLSDRKFSVTSLPYPRNIFCGAQVSNFWIVGADGLLFKCDTFVGNKDYACARLNKDGTIEEFKNAKEWDFSGYKSNDQKCLQCKLLPLCQGGCKAFEKRTGSGCFYTPDLIYTNMLNAHKFLSNQYNSFQRVSQQQIAV